MSNRIKLKCPKCKKETYHRILSGDEEFADLQCITCKHLWGVSCYE